MKGSCQCVSCMTEFLLVFVFCCFKGCRRGADFGDDVGGSAIDILDCGVGLGLDIIDVSLTGAIDGLLDFVPSCP